ncbi:acetylglutamate kinase [Myxococcota bacterium]|nr:acetylglutamate kinase [Myxococcota bacterium]
MLAPLQEKASVLVEALPYIQRFAGATFVVKYGGHAMTDPEAARSFARDVVLLRSIGVRPVIVHGGGPQIQDLLGKLGIPSTFRAGQRVTDDATMDVVRMVLVGQVNQDIVSLVNQAGGRAMGLSGADGQLLLGQKLLVDGQDVGRVGEITRVDTDQLSLLTQGGFIPVIAPVAVDVEGRPLNVNADLAAGAVASHLKAAKLLLMTDVAGVKDAAGQVQASLDRQQARALIAQGVADGGMIPKLDCALQALEAGVGKVHIVDGRVLHALLLEIFTDRGIGTEVV